MGTLAQCNVLGSSVSGGGNAVEETTKNSTGAKVRRAAVAPAGLAKSKNRACRLVCLGAFGVPFGGLASAPPKNCGPGQEQEKEK